MRRLRAFVHVRDPSGGACVFGPGDDPPEWTEGQITNPKAWETVEDAPTPDLPPESLTEPPRHGKGSGRLAWAAYAAAQWDYATDGMSRDRIIDLLDGRDV